MFLEVSLVVDGLQHLKAKFIQDTQPLNKDRQFIQEMMYQKKHGNEC